jgi:hypothetical protein
MHVSHAKKSAVPSQCCFAIGITIRTLAKPEPGCWEKLISVAASVAMRVCFPIRPLQHARQGDPDHQPLPTCQLPPDNPLSNVVGDLLHRTQTQCLKVRALVQTSDEKEREQVRQRRDKPTSFAWAQRLYFAEPMDNSPAVARIMRCGIECAVDLRNCPATKTNRLVVHDTRMI